MPNPIAGPVRVDARGFILRDAAPDDREPTVALADDERLFTHMMIRFSRAEMDAWFTAWLAELDSAERSFWPLVIAARGEPIGFTMLSRASEQVAELQWYVAPDKWGNGAATAATEAVLPLAFDVLGFHRVFATADPANAASVRTLERAGFRREGHMRDYVLAHNGWRDRLMYALLDSEWRDHATPGDSDGSEVRSVD